MDIIFDAYELFSSFTVLIICIFTMTWAVRQRRLAMIWLQLPYSCAITALAIEGSSLLGDFRLLAWPIAINAVGHTLAIAGKLDEKLPVNSELQECVFWVAICTSVQFVGAVSKIWLPWFIVDAFSVLIMGLIVVSCVPIYGDLKQVAKEAVYIR